MSHGESDDPEVHLRRARNREAKLGLLLQACLLATVIASGGVVFVFDLFHPVTFLATVGGVVLLFVPIFKTGGRVVFVTDRSPEAVREAFTGVHNPLMVQVWTRADEEEIETIENGASIAKRTVFSSGRKQIRYRTEERPDGRLRVRTWQGGHEQRRVRVSIEPHEGGARVTTVAELVGRVSCMWFLGQRIQEPHVEAAFEALGYEVVANNSWIRV